MKVVELPIAGSDRVVVQLFVKAPPMMSDREQASWEVLADVLYDGTEEFSRDRLAQYAGQYGSPLLIEAMPEYMLIQVVEPKNGMKVGCQIIEALCKRASLKSEAILESLKRVRTRRTSVWDEALFELELPFGDVREDTVKSLYANAFRPENMTFVFGGDLEPGKGQAEVVDRFKPILTRAPQRVRFDRLPRQRTKHREQVSTFELRGSPISLTKADGAASLLAVFAIGVGKEGTLHRVLREEMGWSYRQEAVLWPTLDGWSPRFVFAKKSQDLTLGGAARDVIVKDIETWGEPQLDRAKSMLRTSLAGENPVSPLWIGRRGPMTEELEDRCAWAGLNSMLLGVTLDEAAINDMAAEVKLGDLKAAAKKLIEEANVSVIPGS